MSFSAVLPELAGSQPVTNLYNTAETHQLICSHNKQNYLIFDVEFFYYKLK